jgi:hypothetical protein
MNITVSLLLMVVAAARAFIEMAFRTSFRPIPRAFDALLALLTAGMLTTFYVSALLAWHRDRWYFSAINMLCVGVTLSVLVALFATAFHVTLARIHRLRDDPETDRKVQPELDAKLQSMKRRLLVLVIYTSFCVPIVSFSFSVRIQSSLTFEEGVFFAGDSMFVLLFNQLAAMWVALWYSWVHRPPSSGRQAVLELGARPTQSQSGTDPREATRDGSSPPAQPRALASPASTASDDRGQLAMSGTSDGI